MHAIISWLYEFPVYCWLVLVLILLLLWTLSAVKFQNSSVWKTLTVIAFVISIVLIVMVTLVFRQTSEDKGFSLIPFSSFEIAKTHSDVYQEVMLNVVLFYPVGLTMPFVINRITNHPVIITIITSCILSVIIEIFQYLFNRGYAEIDDVIFNTLGVVIGSVSFLVFKRFSNHHLII
jgi:glycopeptide antibiotics resistance protein